VCRRCSLTRAFLRHGRFRRADALTTRLFAPRRRVRRGFATISARATVSLDYHAFSEMPDLPAVVNNAINAGQALDTYHCDLDWRRIGPPHHNVPLFAVEIGACELRCDRGTTEGGGIYARFTRA
jgi:hypothetical protein